jgi:hypothetical protein
MTFAHVRGYSVGDAMITTAAVAVGFAVVRAFSDLGPGALILAVPLAVASSLWLVTPTAHILGRQAAWELRLPRLAAAAWLGTLAVEVTIVLGCVVRANL